MSGGEKKTHPTTFQKNPQTITAILSGDCSTFPSRNDEEFHLLNEQSAEEGSVDVIGGFCQVNDMAATTSARRDAP